MVILLSYDLNNHERPSAYEDVKKMIEGNAVSFKKPLYSQWFIETEDSVDVWHERMEKVTDSDDHWFIIQVQKPRQGWLPQSVWTWLKERA